MDTQTTVQIPDLDILIIDQFIDLGQHRKNPRIALISLCVNVFVVVQILAVFEHLIVFWAGFALAWA